jgi:hypothetical protein
VVQSGLILSFAFPGSCVLWQRPLSREGAYLLFGALFFRVEICLHIFIGVLMSRVLSRCPTPHMFVDDSGQAFYAGIFVPGLGSGGQRTFRFGKLSILFVFTVLVIVQIGGSIALTLNLPIGSMHDFCI